MRHTITEDTLRRIVRRIVREVVEALHDERETITAKAPPPPPASRAVEAPRVNAFLAGLAPGSRHGAAALHGAFLASPEGAPITGTMFGRLVMASGLVTRYAASGRRFYEVVGR